LTTALPAAVGINQLANRCDGTGFKIRIIGNRSGGAGVTEERTIIGNTAGTTPTIYLDSALSFTPGSGDGYEILSGRLYCLGMGTTAAGIWKAYDRATNSMLANLSTTNLPATIGTDASFVMLDEQYCINLPGEGFLLGTGDGGIAAHALTATGSSSTTLTGQTSGGDYAINANEYRNFQIRIVKDVSIPTAVGQRRKITSHTGGAATTPVYTVPTWTVTPSVNAQYVIENANECLLWSTASTNTYCYVSDAVGSASADTWSTSTYGVRSGAMAAGCVSFQPFATALDAQKNARYSFIYSWRGGGVTTMDVLDIAGGSTGAWSGAAVYGGSSVLLNTGNSGVYDPFSGYYYMNPVGTNAFSRFQPTHRVMENWAQLRFAQGTAVVGNRMASHAFIDGSTKVPFVFVLAGARTELFHCLISR
jgi:hypothetical protein